MEAKYSWLQVAKEIKRLILSGDYLSEKEKAQVMEVCERNGGPAPVPKARMAI
jgi:hypothetical protein